MPTIEEKFTYHRKREAVHKKIDEEAREIRRQLRAEKLKRVLANANREQRVLTIKEQALKARAEKDEIKRTKELVAKEKSLKKYVII
jgi:hypothetical protein